MRICVLNWLDRENPQAGGAELHLHEAFGRIASAGHDVTVISSGWGEDEPSRTTLDHMTVIRCGQRLTYPLFVRQAFRAAHAEQAFDLVVEDLNKVPIFSPYWTGVPVVLLVHHLFGETAFQEAPWPMAAATWLLERPIGRTYHGLPVIAVSRSTADDLVSRGLEAADIEVIHNGVDLGRFTPSSNRAETPTLLYLGRLKRYKRIDLILAALAALRGRGHDARLLIAGTGDYRDTLVEQVRALGLSQHVDFLGYISEDDKVRVFQESWVHVLMSEKEGWGLTNVEAGACGTATVAADAPGLRDSVQDGQTGVLVPGDNVGALTEALVRFVTDRAYVESMGSRAAEFAQSLTWDSTAGAILGTLTRVLARGTP